MFIRITGFENYIVDENGTVINTATNHIKKPCDNNMGYLYIDLYNQGKHRKEYIHRLVAKAFIPNPKNKPYINHIDGNPHNNFVGNLEWCTPLENVEHASKMICTMKQYLLANIRRKRAVKQIERQSGKLINVFSSIQEASRATGIPSPNIVSVLKGRQTYTKNYVWCYVEELEA